MFGFVGVALGYFCGVGTFYFSVCIGLHYVFCSYINTISKFIIQTQLCPLVQFDLLTSPTKYQAKQRLKVLSRLI